MAAAYPFDTSHTAWISRGFEVLEDRVQASTTALHFDVLIIGSGYGGAVAAATFAGRTRGGGAVRVGVLERGKEYLPGAFPVGLRELPRHVRSKSNKEGLFDIRVSPEANVVIANGLGGGSLINAGVMEIPAAGVFASGWPVALQSFHTQGHFGTARDLLGAYVGGAPNTILNHPQGAPQKYLSAQATATPLPPGATFRAAAITVAMGNTTSSGKVALKTCVRCGDCATGCNFGAKNSLDVNLLVTAHQRGAELFSGATVLSIARDTVANVWLVRCVHTNAKLRARDDTVITVRATKVVLAAGALGSTEILLRSKANGLALSSTLGQRCSTNGDMLITDYDTNADVHTVADERTKPSERDIGPTITSVLELPKTPDRPRLIIEEMSVPAGLRVAFTELFATVNTLHSLNEKDSTKHEQGFPSDDIYAVSKQQIERSALYAVMADDGAAGTIELVDNGKPLTPADDGVARMRWQEDKTVVPKKDALPDLKVFDQQVEALAERTRDKTDGRLLPNPVWKLLPTDLEWLLEKKRGPLTTVHPLGGCAMADSGTHGVVDDCGRVYSSSTSAAKHDGLVVLDGSIIPTALGTNPALTITAVALRATAALAIDWGYAAAVPATAAATALARPVFRPTDFAFDPPPTEVEVIERLAGPVEFKAADGTTATRVVELTLRFAPKAVLNLARPPQDGGHPVLQVAGSTPPNGIASRIRIYDLALWQDMERRWTPDRRFEEELESIALFSAPLTGSVRVFERQKSRSILRWPRAAAAWWSNRGKRDTNASIVDGDDGPGALARIKSGVALASRSGEIRWLTYDLAIGNADADPALELTGTSKRIKGHKTFTYAKRANPWRQLMEVELDEFPGLKSSADERVLKLDPRYLVRIGVPLFRISKQTDGATALAEIGSFIGYFLRLLLGLHIWSFRAPDKQTSTAAPERLPRTNLPDLPVAHQFPIPLPDEVPAGGTEKYVGGQVIMTHFAQPTPDPNKRPLVMLHGYSASGTTFAHHAVPNNFASHFWNKGWDVWIADLRTSSGQASAVEHWSFEQIGRTDIPAAIQKVIDETGASKVDVIAHCMGTVVFSMAMLDTKTANNVPNQVERVAFTQVGPLVVFSPANIFRGYVLRYLIDFLPEEYSFVPPAEPTLADDLWDRLLATLPYPEEEFDIENPPGFSARTPWTRTRHRMDALYGRDFNVVNMEADMLRHIDDHFGPLSLRTVAQTLHFVRYSMITNYEGQNEFVSREELATRWKQPTLSVHGADNGLAHVSTVHRMGLIFKDAGVPYLDPTIIANTGHQDALVGTKRAAAQAAIEQFLTAPIATVPTPPNDALVAYPPWLGPIITEQLDQTPALIVRVGSSPMHRRAESVGMLRIALDGDRIVRPDDPTKPWDSAYVIAHMAIYDSSALTAHRWDAFEAPLPTLMPGYQPGDNLGDGLLVLILYAESPDLGPPPGIPARDYWAANPITRTVGLFSPVPTVRPVLGGPPVTIASRREITYTYFERAADAFVAALVKQPVTSAEARRLAARDRPGHARLLGAATSARLELPIGTFGNPSQTTAALVFGTNPAQGKAVAETLLLDRDLMDGVIPYDPPVAPFPTMPNPAGTRFALMSCQYPPGFLDAPIANSSYGRLLKRLGSAAGGGPRFTVLTGDQVYVDPTAGLYDPSAQDDRYRRPYELWLRQREVRGALRRVPSFMLLDDHEIDDNWEPVSPTASDSAENNTKRTAGLSAYEQYQRGMPPKPTAFKFKFDGFPFFMLDTRTDRTLRKVGALGTATLIDDAPGGTLSQLETWLATAPAGPKFVVTPSMLLPRHRRAVQHTPTGGGLTATNLSAIHSDGWDGYPETLRKVLGLIAKNGFANVVFLSGDEHRGCVANIELRDNAGTTLLARVHSIHTTAAYAPFPFANALAEEFVANETIDFAYGTSSYKCVVNATLPNAGDGATLLRPWRDGAGAWRLDYEYADGTVQTLTL